MIDLLISNLGEEDGAVAPPRRTRMFPRGIYYGFAIGSDSHHDQVTLVLPGGRTAVVQVGKPYIGCVDGEVEVQKVRYLRQEDTARIIAFTCPSELVAAFGKRPSERLAQVALPAGDPEGLTTDVIIPMAGRRHAQLIIQCVGTGITYRVYGQKNLSAYDPDDPAVADYEVELTTATALTTTVEIGHNIGEPGTRPEYWDYLRVRFAGVSPAETVTVISETSDD